MLDWKILAASFAALLIVSSVLIGGLGFTDIVDNIRDWLGGSPFGGIVDFPEAGSKAASVTIYSTPLSLLLDSPINATISDASMTGFSGTLESDLDESTLSLISEGFTLSFPLSNTTLGDIVIGKLLLENSDFSVMNEDLETSAENGTLELSDFSGEVTFTKGMTTLSGNFTSIKGNNKQII
jgi:hypothetical protein